MDILKRSFFQNGLIYLLNFLCWIESVQKKIRLEEIENEEKKKNFWLGNTDLESDRPNWMKEFELLCLTPNFIDNIIWIINQTPQKEEILIYFLKNSENMEKNNIDSFSNRIDMGTFQFLQNKIIKSFFKNEMEDQKDKILEKINDEMENEWNKTLLLKNKFTNEILFDYYGNFKDTEIKDTTLYSGKLISGKFNLFFNNHIKR
jgi:hypothetical protein